MARQTQLCRYAYDPLDRLASRTSLAAAVKRDFYRSDRLATQIQGAEQRSFVHHDNQLLAQHAVVGKLASTALTATDSQASVLHANNTAIAYSPYGHRARIEGLPGFNGEQPDPVTGHYLLGNGYRAYNPTLMRFNSPDNLSPFDKGGLNAYAYCAGDPVNCRDPSGHESESDLILRFAWIGLGFLSAAWGVRVALPAIKAVAAGGAKASQWLSSTGAVGQVAASTVFISSRIIDAVEPESPVAEGLMWGALALGIPSFGLRVSGFRVARKEAMGPPAAGSALAKADRAWSYYTKRIQSSQPIRSTWSQKYQQQKSPVRARAIRR